MNHDDIIKSHYRTAEITATNNLHRHLNREGYAQDDAESRAFHAERELLGTKQAHDDEQREHALTRLAMKILLAQNFGLQRTVKHLAEKWAARESVTAEAFTADLMAKADKAANLLLAQPDNEARFARDIDILRNAQRLGPKT